MERERPVRWGILGTANIARSRFLSGLHAAGGGMAYAVAGRDPARTARYAADNGIEHAIVGYENLLAGGDVDIVYIALPNSLHAEWTMAALRAGKPVLCEQPLCVSVEQTEEVLGVARETGQLLWEAFVFPFHPQMHRLRELIRGGDLGDVRETHSSLHFRLRSRENIRLSPDLAGGSLNDVGCYCIRLADLIFEDRAQEGMALARWAPEGVDEAMDGVLGYPADHHLLFSCGMSRPWDSFSRVIGSEGEIRMSNPYHPEMEDVLEVRRGADVQVEQAGGDKPSFAFALRRIQAAIRGEEAPRHLARDDALPVAIGLELARRSARSGRREEL